MPRQQSYNPATKADIARILRTSDTELIGRITATGVTHTELVEAFLRVAQEFETDTDICCPNHRVARAMAILAEDSGGTDSPDE